MMNENPAMKEAAQKMMQNMSPEEMLQNRYAIQSPSGIVDEALKRWDL